MASFKFNFLTGFADYKQNDNLLYNPLHADGICKNHPCSQIHFTAQNYSYAQELSIYNVSTGQCELVCFSGGHFANPVMSELREWHLWCILLTSHLPPHYAKINAHLEIITKALKFSHQLFTKLAKIDYCVYTRQPATGSSIFKLNIFQSITKCLHGWFSQIQLQIFKRM